MANTTTCPQKGMGRNEASMATKDPMAKQVRKKSPKLISKMRSTPAMVSHISQ